MRRPRSSRMLLLGALLSIAACGDDNAGTACPTKQPDKGTSCAGSDLCTYPAPDNVTQWYCACESTGWNCLPGPPPDQRVPLVVDLGHD